MIVCLKFTEKLLRRVLEIEPDVIVVRDAYDLANEAICQEVMSRLRRVYTVARLDSIEEMSAIFVDLELEHPGQTRAVLCGAEYGMFAAAYLRTALGIDPREPGLTITARDKRWMKKSFTNAGIRCARFIPTYRPGDEVPADMFPVVAKPTAGTGSYNTAILASNVDLSHFVATERLHPALVSTQWAIEEKLTGDEYHVDMIWVGGTVAFTSVGKYMVPRLSALENPARNGSIILSPAAHAELYAEFIDIMSRFAQAEQVVAGVTHAEFFMDESGHPYLSEIATRVAGAVVPQVIQASFGVDIVEAWLRAELGLSPDVSTRAEGYRLAGFLSVSPSTDGEVLDVPTLEQYLAMDGVVEVVVTVAPGDHYRHDSPSNWCVLLVLTAEGEQQFLERCDEIYARLPVTVRLQQPQGGAAQ